MLDKNPDNRITIPEIKVTQRTKQNMSAIITRISLFVFRHNTTVTFP